MATLLVKIAQQLGSPTRATPVPIVTARLSPVEVWKFAMERSAGCRVCGEVAKRRTGSRGISETNP